MFTAEKGPMRYIRPILLVQVERTGKEQRDGRHIHSEDVKEWLLAAGLDAAEVAIKTAEKNDLNQPENLDLLSRKNRVRAIVTKSALQEGWDCPFAYVLCSLCASSNLSAMTEGFKGDNTTSVGQLELTGSGETLRCELILMKDIKAGLPRLL